MKLKKSQDHPERQDDEFFLGNSSEKSFKTIKWKTKRLGQKAFDIGGNDITDLGLFPTFISQEEVGKSGEIWQFVAR